MHVNQVWWAWPLRFGNFAPFCFPSKFPFGPCVFGSTISVDHALSCLMDSFSTLQHNELQDLTASLLVDVCSNVSREPTLQPLSGESLLLYPLWMVMVLMLTLRQMASRGFLIREHFLMSR